MTDDFLDQLQDVKSQLSQFRQFLDRQSIAARDPFSPGRRGLTKSDKQFYSSLFSPTRSQRNSPSGSPPQGNSPNFSPLQQTNNQNDEISNYLSPYRKNGKSPKHKYAYHYRNEENKKKSSVGPANDSNDSNSFFDDEIGETIFNHRKNSGSSSPFDKYHFKSPSANDSYYNLDNNTDTENNRKSENHIENENNRKSENHIVNENNRKYRNEKKMSNKVNQESLNEKNDQQNNSDDLSESTEVASYEISSSSSDLEEQSPHLSNSHSNEAKNKKNDRRNVIQAVRLVDKYMQTSPPKSSNKNSPKNHHKKNLNNQIKNRKLKIGGKLAVPFSGSYEGEILRIENENNHFNVSDNGSEDKSDNEKLLNKDEQTSSSSEVFDPPVPDVFEIPEFTKNEEFEGKDSLKNDNLANEEDEVIVPHFSVESSESDNEDYIKGLLKDTSSDSESNKTEINKKSEKIKKIDVIRDSSSEKQDKNTKTSPLNSNLSSDSDSDIVLKKEIFKNLKIKTEIEDDDEDEVNLSDLMNNLMNSLNSYEKTNENTDENLSKTKQKSNNEEENVKHDEKS
ncbi:hypothetical protein TRFO_40306 [Tritrichomonas foetus]|uniref:Uncharacterized protein n=1 Tax=Tritrichomonas foetus TaxID=1144522 RepID=A0A1J4J1B4_9EUKA|nr:hypothetical protein TRFO_40306 [Tritrichomonas foetus]|eukprot:OHS93382.1 hypothetical protein TRFO_40306 [Tritrichomonas foetus]